MNWWLPRVVAPLTLMGLGALIGFMLAGAGAVAPWWAVVGALLGLIVAVAWDTWRGRRVLHWFKDHPADPAPIASGLWGEAAYRIERSLRTHERQLDDERLQRTQFLAAIDASPNGVTLIDRVDGIVWCNAQASDHLSLDPERDQQQRITNIVREPAFVDALARGETTEPVVFNDPRSQRRLSVVIRRYGPGMRIVLSQDITDTERTDSMRRHFVANVSHEIRTPLTVLSGALESLMTLPLDDGERQRMMALMAQQTQRMQLLIDDLLTLASLEGSPRPAPDLWTALDPVWAQCRADALLLSGGRHRITFDMQPATEVAANATEFTSLVANLVGNAIRYTADGGAIDVRWVVAAGGAGELSVADSGVGIAREHIARITERFYRVDSARARDTGGTGLGLSIVKHIVQRHGAELLIQSEVGQGSTFLIRMPSARVRAH